MSTKRKPTEEELLALFIEYKQSVPLKINPYSFKMWLERNRNIKLDRKTIISRLGINFENKKISIQTKSQRLVETMNILGLIEDCLNDPKALRELGNHLQRDFDAMYLITKDTLEFEKENNEFRLRITQLKKEINQLHVENKKLIEDVVFYSDKSDQLIALSANSVYYSTEENVILKMKGGATKFHPPILKVVDSQAESKAIQEKIDPRVSFIEKLQGKSKKSVLFHTPKDIKGRREDIKVIGGAFQENNLVQVVEQCKSLDINTAMIYLSSEVVNYFNTKHLPRLQIGEGIKFIKQKCHPNFQLSLHSSLRLNLANLTDEKISEQSVKLLKKQIEIADNYYYAKSLIIHPGSYIRMNDYETGIKLLIKSLNEVITDHQDVEIVIENMTGKGTELGKNFYELASILDGVIYSDKVKICLDTCHLWDSGFDIKGNLDGVLTEFDKLIGLEKVSMLHINDSMGDINSKLDRHANIGSGKIGIPTLSKICKLSEFENVMKILETPKIGGLSPYRHEIRILEDGVVYPLWMECIERDILLPFDEMYH